MPYSFSYSSTVFTKNTKSFHFILKIFGTFITSSLIDLARVPPMVPRDLLVAGAGRVLDNHRRVSACMYVFGVLLILSYPLLQRKVFIDENAFLHGHSAIGFSGNDASDAYAYSSRAEAKCVNLTDPDAVFDCLTEFTTAELENLGLDVSTHEYRTDTTRINIDASKVGNSNNPTNISRRSTHAVVRSKKSPGREGVVFATMLGSPDTDGIGADSAAIGVGLAFVKFLQQAKWTAKDFVWLVLDARADSKARATASAVNSADNWLKEYYGYEGLTGGADIGGMAYAQTVSTPKSTFHRAGALQQAYVFSVPAGANVDTVLVSPEGKDGALPNQDLLNTAVQLSRRAFPGCKVTLDLDLLDPIEKHARIGRVGSGDRATLEKHENNAKTKNANRVSAVAESIGVLLFGSRKRNIIRKYVADLRRAFRFAWRCALGIPTGAHASFKAFAVDSVTLRLGVPLGEFEKGHVNAKLVTENFRKIGTLFETLARGSNNLIEQLHHSMFYYVMTSDTDFLSIAEYVAPQALVVGAALLGAVALATRGIGMEDTKNSMDVQGADDSKNSKHSKHSKGIAHDWGSALALVAATHAAGGLIGYVSLRAFATGASPGSVFAVTSAAATFGVPLLAAVAKALYKGDLVDSPMEPPWVTVKCVSLASMATATAAVTFFNFPLALPTATVLVAVCLSSGSPKKAYEESGEEITRSRVLRKVKACFMALCPLLLVVVLSLIAGTDVTDSLYFLARAVRNGENQFPFPTLFVVVWPACTLSGLVTWMEGLHGGGRREEESKKRR